MTLCQVHIHRAGFVRMQYESGPGHPFPELFMSMFGKKEDCYLPKSSSAVTSAFTAALRPAADPP